MRIDTRIRVLELVSGIAVEGPSGGIGRFAFELSMRLDTSLFNTKLIGLWKYGLETEAEKISILRGKGVDCFLASDWVPSSPRRSFWRSTRAICQYLVKNPVDIIHSHSEFGDVIAVLIKAYLKTDLAIRTVHNLEWVKRPSRRFLFSKFTAPIMFDQEIGVSKYLTNTLNQRITARLLGKKALYIPNGIDFQRFSQKHNIQSPIRHELKIPDEYKIIGTIGRLAKQKGHVELLHAAVGVIHQMPQTIFIIVGEGEERDRLMIISNELGLNENVRFLGMRTDIEEILEAIDLYVSPSLWEGLPTTLLESIASAIPVVATEIEGSKELVRPGVTGVLVPPGDTDGLVSAILKSLETPRSQRLGTSGPRNFLAEYTIETVTEKYEKAYLSLHKKMARR